MAAQLARQAGARHVRAQLRRADGVHALAQLLPHEQPQDAERCLEPQRRRHYQHLLQLSRVATLQQKIIFLNLVLHLLFICYNTNTKY